MKNILSKFIVAAIATTVAAGTAIPAYADAAKALVVDNKSVVSYNYEMSVENAIYNVNQTINALDKEIKAGNLDYTLTDKLELQLTELESSICKWQGC